MCDLQVGRTVKKDGTPLGIQGLSPAVKMWEQPRVKNLSANPEQTQALG